MNGTAQNAGPWNNDYGNAAIVRAKNDRARGTLVVCECLDAEDAAFIVRACNAHDDMLAALRNVQKLITEAAMTGFNAKDGDWPDRLFHSQQKTSAAIAKAEGRS